MQKERYLFLPIETISRELDGKLLLATAAAREGFKVIIGRKDPVLRKAIEIGSGIFFYKDHAGSGWMFNRLKKNGVQSVALDEEGLVILNSKAYLSRIGTETVLQNLSRIFTFGEKTKTIIEKQYPGLHTPVLSVGNPRFDLIRPAFRSLYNKEVDLIKKKYNTFILINTKFAAFNYAKFYKESFLDRHKKRKNITSEKLNEIQKKIDYYSRVMDEYVSMIFFCAKKHPKINFVLRPHPSEELSTWKEKLKSLSNVFVIRKKGVLPWILASEGVIHTSCTTGIEAFVAGKPVYQYNPVYEKDMESVLPNRVSTYIGSKEEMADVIGFRKNEAKSLIDLEKKDILKKHLENLDGPYAYEIILQELKKIKIDRKANPLNIKPFHIFKETIKGIVREYLYFMGIGKFKHINSKFIRLKKSFLEYRLNFMNKAMEGKETKLSIKKIDRDTYLIKQP